MFENEVEKCSNDSSKNAQFLLDSTSKSDDFKHTSMNYKFNQGRWRLDEHQRFLQAIFKFGNKWKSVQSLIGTRSSSQARSHAQKFFSRLKNKIFNNKIRLFTKSEKDLDTDVKEKYERTFYFLKSTMSHRDVNLEDLIKHFFSFNKKHTISQKKEKKSKKRQIFSVYKHIRDDDCWDSPNNLKNHILQFQPIIYEFENCKTSSSNKTFTRNNDQKVYDNNNLKINPCLRDENDPFHPEAKIFSDIRNIYEPHNFYQDSDSLKGCPGTSRHFNFEEYDILRPQSLNDDPTETSDNLFHMFPDNDDEPLFFD